MPGAITSVLFARSVRGVDRAAVRAFHRRLREDVAGGRDFSCLIAGDRTLRRLNRDFLGHDYATDVLSFPSGEPAGGEASLGDIAISAGRAREQAAEFGHGVEEEIRILMLHGVLHLLGYDHERDRGAMARVETRWRKQFDLPVSLIERARRRRSS